MTPLITLLILLSASIGTNISLIFLLKQKRKRGVRQQSIELQEFLSDLMGGGGMLAVKRMDPNDFMMRSPKR